MNKIFKKSMSWLMVLALTVQTIPFSNNSTVFAAETLVNDLPEKIEIDVDDYIKLSVSKENGGFLIDTGEGDKLEAEDDNKFLMYPDEYYDTSYTSFKITEENGSSKDYIFGREYGFLGMSSEMISTEIQNGNTVVSKWKLNDLVFTQTLVVLNEANVSHGMVEISYTVENTGNTNYSDIKARILLDTALGYQDYGYYELPTGEFGAGEKYTTVESEVLLDNAGGKAYDSMFFVYDDLVNPKVRAYTVNANVGNETIEPTEIAFGHWQNFSNQVFDFTPQEDLFFTNPYNIENMTADSAYALYFDMGAVASGQSSKIATNYGIFSNSDETGNNDIIINFSKTPAPLALDPNSSEPQYTNGGAFEIAFQLQNQSEADIEDVWLDVKLQAGVSIADGEEYSERIEVGKINRLGNADYSLNLVATAENEISDYRSIVIQAYKGTTPISSAQEIYVFCPGIGTDGVVVNSLTPEIIYNELERDIFISMAGTGAVKNKGDYDLKLINTNTKEEYIVPPSDITVFTGDNSVQIHLEHEMTPGAWSVLFDFKDETADDVTSGSLTFSVTDDPKFKPNTYGLVTIERDSTSGDERNNYSIKIYKDEEEYSKLNTDPNNLTMLEFRGLFTVKEGTKDDPKELIGISDVLADGTVQNTMVISNTLDVEDGIITITNEDDTINVDMDAKIYTTGARTVVWNGVCAISSFEDGEQMELLQYNYDGKVVGSDIGEMENSVANTNAITLIWPGAASTAQTIGGVLMELRYGQFGQMATERGTVTSSTPKVPVLAFGAQLSPDLLVPSSYWSSGAEANNLSQMEQRQMDLVNDSANPYYEAKALRDIQDKYASAQENHENWSNAKLGLYVHDILFSGGFVGFNASIEVGIPAYVDGMPSLEGQLDLKVINNEWEFGVNGAADLAVVSMEGSLKLKSYNGIPVPDSVYFFVGGFSPGINVDGFGVFWIQGAGGGFSDLYSTIFPTSKIPPLTLLISGQFGLFGVLTTRADLGLSLRGIDATLSEIGVNGVTVIDKMGLAVNWYPEIRLYAGIDITILNAILGSGYLVLEEDQVENEWFWEGFARVTVKIPDYVPVVGDIEIGNIGLGMDVDKAWGSMNVLDVDLGLTYDWYAGSVEFSTGKYNVPEPTYDLISTRNNTPTVRVMNIGTPLATFSRINESTDRYIHQLPIPVENDNDVLAEVAFVADSVAEAEKIAENLTVVSTDGDERTLVWDDGDGTTPNANAMLVTTQNGSVVDAKVILSFSESGDFNKTWEIGIDANSTLSNITLERLPSIDSATVTNNSIEITGDLSEMKTVKVFAKTDDMVYPLAEVESPSGNTTTLTLNPSQTLPTGTYQVEVVAETIEQTSNPIILADGNFVHTNPHQPNAPTLEAATLGGDFTIDVPVTPKGEIDGYQATIYEVNADGSKTAVQDFPRQNIEYNSEDNVIVVGGSYTVIKGDDESSTETEVISLEAGKKYVVGIQSYNEAEVIDDPENVIAILSEEVLSNELTMVAPQKTEISLELANSKLLTSDVMPSDGEVTHSYQTVNSDDISVTVSATNGTVVKGQYSLDGGELKDWNVGNTITARDLQSGMHTLSFTGENNTGDTVFSTIAFNVDTVAPKLLISSEINGFFNNSDLGTELTISGISETDATLYAMVEGENKTELTVNSTDGSFTIDIPLDRTKAYQNVQLKAVDKSGNESKLVSIPLVNAKLSAETANYSIYQNGTDVTNTEIESTYGVFSLVLTADNGEVITINDDSIVTANEVNWTVTPKEGNASIANGKLTTDFGATGILSANIDGYIVSVGYNAVVPVITEGENQTITQGEPITFTSSGLFSDYLETKVDGKTVDGNYITLNSGSTIVTLSGDFTNTLTPGEHTVSLVFNTGEATTTFTVLAKSTDNNGGTDSGTGTDTDNPDTGDSSNIGLLLMIIAICGLALIVILKKRSTNSK